MALGFLKYKALIHRQGWLGFLPPAIHVAGTNGKTSTVLMIAHLLKALGFRVGTYTSPHLISENERIQINGHPVCKRLLNEFLNYVDAELFTEGSLGYFERMTAAAFSIFHQTPLDFLVMETGIGGRLDATNVIENKILSVITKIDYDHQDLLGNTLDKIAQEKAGIIQESCPVIVLNQGKQVLDVFKHICQQKKASMTTVGCEKNSSFMEQNARMAKHAVMNFIPSVTYQQLDIIMGRYQSVGRLQNIQVSQNIQLWVDGAHNPGASRDLGKVFPQKKLILIYGCRQGRDPQAFLRPLKSQIHYLIPVDFYAPDAIQAQSILDGANLPGETSQSWQAVMAKIEEILPRESHEYEVILTGSLYLVGDFLRSYQKMSE